MLDLFGWMQVPVKKDLVFIMLVLELSAVASRLDYCKPFYPDPLTPKAKTPFDFFFF